SLPSWRSPQQKVKVAPTEGRMRVHLPTVPERTDQSGYGANPAFVSFDFAKAVDGAQRICDAPEAPMIRESTHRNHSGRPPVVGARSCPVTTADPIPDSRDSVARTVSSPSGQVLSRGLSVLYTVVTCRRLSLCGHPHRSGFGGLFGERVRLV